MFKVYIVMILFILTDDYPRLSLKNKDLFYVVTVRYLHNSIKPKEKRRKHLMGTSAHIHTTTHPRRTRIRKNNKHNKTKQKNLRIHLIMSL